MVSVWIRMLLLDSFRNQFRVGALSHPQQCLQPAHCFSQVFLRRLSQWFYASQMKGLSVALPLRPPSERSRNAAPQHHSWPALPHVDRRLGAAGRAARRSCFCTLFSGDESDDSSLRRSSCQDAWLTTAGIHASRWTQAAALVAPKEYTALITRSPWRTRPR